MEVCWPDIYVEWQIAILDFLGTQIFDAGKLFS